MEYLINISGIIIVSIFLKFFIPNGKTKKFITWITSLLITIMIISPIFSYLGSGFKDFNNKLELQQNYLDFTFNEKINADLERFSSLISNDVKNYSITPDYEIIDYSINYKKIQIDLKNAVITSDKSHIDIINKIKTSVNEVFGKDVIINIDE